MVGDGARGEPRVGAAGVRHAQCAADKGDDALRGDALRVEMCGDELVHDGASPINQVRDPASIYDEFAGEREANDDFGGGGHVRRLPKDDVDNARCAGEECTLLRIFFDNTGHQFVKDAEIHGPSPRHGPDQSNPLRYSHHHMQTNPTISHAPEYH